MKKKLNEIIACDYDLDISGVVDDSRLVKEGYLFVATKGYYVDHFDYIEDAIKHGAVAVISDRACTFPICSIVVENSINEVYLNCCEKFYGVRPENFSLIGITGTDGKTTTASIVQQLLNSFISTAYIGTNGLFVNDKTYPVHNTTPCVSELYQSFSIIQKDNCKDIVMEVSSEASLHHRVDHLKFDIIGYTNITEDHLNIHKTIDNYRKCKLDISKQIADDGVILINGDDEICKHVKGRHVYSYGFSPDNDYVICDVKKLSNFVNFHIKCKDDEYCIDSPFLGTYNIYNVTLAFLICLFKHIDSEILIAKIKSLKPVYGRRERLDFGQEYDIILDYAHTINGVRNILESVSNYKRIITVTGAAGGRDKAKRPKIGKMVLEKSDLVIFTMDDPRYENVDSIIDDLVGDCSIPYMRILNRAEAIKKALSMADKDSVVLILGKGRDSYMAIESRRVEYSDYDVVETYFKEIS